MPSSADPVALHRRLWGDGAGDSEAELCAAEGRLGVSLPLRLREFLGAAALRRSVQLHLEPLAQVRWDDDVLVFGADQQRSAFFGIERAAVSLADPPVVVGPIEPAPHWRGDCPSLSLWLCGFSLLNRAYEPPCANECVPDDRMPGWEPWQVAGNTLFALGRAASDGVNVGAVTRRELIAALQSLDLEEDEVEIFE